MRGTSNTTGKKIGGTQLLRQYIADILTTPIGTRVISRDYGSRLFELLDKPLTPLTNILLKAASIDALRRWLPQLRVSKFDILTVGANGRIAYTLTATDTSTGAPLTLTDTITTGAPA